MAVTVDTVPKVETHEENLLSVADVAERLRVSNMTVYRMVKSKEIAAYRLHNRWRIPQTALSDYLAANYQPARDEGEG